MAVLIEGKVARILSDNCLVLNVGAAAGVKTGMIFVVIAVGEQVVDPDSSEMLGRWELPKGYLRVTHTQDRLSTCEGWLPGGRQAPEDPSTDVLSAALITHSMHPESWGGAGSAALNVNRAEIAGLPRIGPVSVGDTAREFRPDEAALKAQVEPGKRTSRPKPAPGKASADTRTVDVARELEQRK